MKRFDGSVFLAVKWGHTGFKRVGRKRSVAKRREDEIENCKLFFLSIFINVYTEKLQLNINKSNILAN